MKKYSSLFLLLFLLSCNYQFIDKPGLKGKVKKFTEYKMSIENNVVKDTFSIMTTTYNRKGQIVDQIIELKNGETFNQDFEYDKKENLIKEISYYDDNKIVVNYEYKDTLLIRAYSISEADSIYTKMDEIYYYNDKNKLDSRHYSQILVSDNDTSTYNNKYFYDKNEKLNEYITQYKSISNSIFSKTKFDYNKFGLYSKTYSYNNNDKLTTTDEYKYEYDNNGSWVKKEIIRNDILEYIYTRKIDYQ